MAGAGPPFIITLQLITLALLFWDPIKSIRCLYACIKHIHTVEQVLLGSEVWTDVLDSLPD